MITPFSRTCRDPIDLPGRSRVTLAALAVTLLSVACTATVTTTTTSTTTPVPTTTTTTLPPVLTGVGFEDDTVLLGALLPLSGSLEPIGRSMLAGQQVYWSYVNDTLGGVGGRFPVDLRELDTAYDEETARAILLDTDPVLAISSVLGSAITATLAEELAGTDILASAGSLASSWGGSPNLVLDLAFPTYRDQIAGAVIAGGAEEPPVEIVPPLGLFYQEGSYGEDCLNGFDQATERLPEGSTLRASHPPSATEFGEELGTMREAGVATLFVCSTSQVLLRVLATLDLLDYRPTVVATAQSYDPSILAALGGEGGEAAGLELAADLHLVGSLPLLEGEAPGIRLLRDNLERYGGDEVDQWLFLGYTQAATLHAILEEAFDGGDLTRGGLVAARDRIGAVDLGFGAGPARYDEQLVPVVADVVSVPAPTADHRFGMRPVGTHYPTR